MAGKKIFTDHEYQTSAHLVTPKVHTVPNISSHAGVLGQLASSGNNLYFHDGSNWFALIESNYAGALTGRPNFDPATGNIPFTVGSGHTDKVDNLNADLLDGYDTSTSAAASKIPVYGSSGVLKVGTPVATGDATTKAYVDDLVQGLDIKGSVAAASTGNLTLSGTQTVDGVSLSAGNRVLVKDQSTASQNGIYIVASGSWSLASDSDAGSLSEGAYVFVEAGTANNNTGWTYTDSSSYTWAQFSGAGQLNAGDGLVKSGDTLSANVASPISIVSDQITIADGAITGSKLANNTVTSTQLADSIQLNHIGLGVAPDTTYRLKTTGKSRFYNTTDIALLAETTGTNTAVFNTTSAPPNYIVDFRLAGNSKVRIEPDGDLHAVEKIAVGSGSPTYDVHVQRLNARIAADNGTVETLLQADSTIGYVGTNTNHKLILKTNNTSRVEIENDGDVKVIGKLGVNTSPVSLATATVNGTLQATFGHFTGWSSNSDTGTGLGLDVGVSGGKGYVMAYNRTSGTYADLRIVPAGGSTGLTLLSASGDVGCNTLSPSTKFHIYDSTSGTTASARSSVIDTLAIETHNTGQTPYNGFGQGIVFRGVTYNNTSTRTLGRIAHVIRDDSSATTTGTAIRFQTQDDPGTTNAPVTQMEVGTDVEITNKLGIGVSPSHTLDVNGDIHTDAVLRMTRSGTFNLYPSSNNVAYELAQSGEHIFKTNNTVYFTIGSGGHAELTDKLTIGNLPTSTADNSLIVESSGLLKKRTANSGIWTTNLGANRFLVSDNSGVISSDSRLVHLGGRVSFTGSIDGAANLKVDLVSDAITTNQTSYEKCFYASGLNGYNISSGVTDSGYRIAVDASAFVSTSTFAGTLAKQKAVWARHGANVSSSGSTITDSYGVIIESLTNSDTTITNLWGLYQSSGAAKNYFAGSVGIGSGPDGTHKLIVNGKSKLQNDIVFSSANPRIDFYSTNSGIRFFSLSSNAEKLRLTDSGLKLVDISTSTTDTNVIVESSGLLKKRATHPGAFAATTTQGATNLNSVSDGWHKWGSSSNKPVNAPNQYMVMLQHPDVNQDIQLAYGGSGYGKLFIRRKDSGTFYDWTEFYSTENLTLSTLGGVGGSGTVGKIPLWTNNTTTLGNSVITQSADGTLSVAGNTMIKGGALLGIENASVTNAAYISNVGGSGVSKLNIADTLYVVEGGNCGIGTADPDSVSQSPRLAVRHSGAGIATFDSTATNGGYLTIANSNTPLAYLGSSAQLISSGGTATDAALRSQGELIFATGGTSERMRIDAVGNCGIGTASPATKLDIYGEQYNSFYPTMLRVIDNVTAFDTDNNGGGISFGGRYTSGGVVNFLAGIQGVKENNTSGNYNAALRFLIRENGTSLFAEKMRLSASGNLGIGTNDPVSTLEIVNNNESTTQTNFTQALSSAGLIINTQYTDNAYTPGLFWKTSNSHVTKPKAGIYLKGTASGTNMYFGTSNNYSTGITNDALVINPNGNVGINCTPNSSFKLDVNGGGRFTTSLRSDGYISIASNTAEFYIANAAVNKFWRQRLSANGSEYNLVFDYNDGASNITPLTLSNTGHATFSGTITSTNNANSAGDNIVVSTTNKDSSLYAISSKRSGTTVGGMRIDGRFRASDGSATLPAYAFTDDPNTGMFRAGADHLQLVSGGTGRLKVTADVSIIGATDLLVTGANRRLSFTSGSGTVRTTTAADLYLATNNTNRVQVTSGGAVKATRDGGSNLIQVARIHDGSLTGNGTATSFTITHNLETGKPIAVVIDGTSGAYVEAQIVVASDNAISVTFNNPPASGKVYRVPVTG